MSVREIEASLIEKTVEKLFIEANYFLPEDIKACIEAAKESEDCTVCRNALEQIIENLSAANELEIPICQDTGMAVLFAKIGQDVHIYDGGFEEAVNKGVKKAYVNGYMRCSIVSDPLSRINTNDNTPAVIHTEIVPGDKIELTAAPKGFGSENMSRIKMFNPSANKNDIIKFILSSVTKAGSNPCPPVVVGVGIGGNFEKAAILSKKALTRSLNKRNPDKFYAEMEEEALRMINETGIGAQGFGGNITALGVNIEVFPTHIAGLPVAVNMGCHVTRHKTAVI